MKKTAVIGAGPAGMTVAGMLREAGAEFDIYEHSERPGRKLGITGKGRCNLTNNCSAEEFINNVPTNPRFLYGTVNSFSPSDTMELFERLGVPLKTERGQRVFPVSDKARDVVDALVGFMGHRPIRENVTAVGYENGRFTVRTEKAERTYDAVVIATGGKSYPATGSTGDGYGFAASLGHTVTPLYPSLIPLTVSGGECAEMMGLSLKNVAVSVVSLKNGRTVYTDFGEMLFTHFGISGPVVLSASSHMRRIVPGEWRFDIDLKPALNPDKLDRRLLSDFEKYKNKDLRNALGDLLPRAMIPVFIGKCGIDPQKKVNSVTRAERQTMIGVLKRFSLDISGTRPIEEAIVTSGGVSVKEIDPRTMQSKLVPGLFFAGEVIDIDAYTGGFNLQIAFSTAASAARAIVKMENAEKTPKSTDNRKSKPMVNIAIDGPSGAGKSTLAKRIAHDLGYIYVDTGALYRAVGLYMSERGIDSRDEESVIAALDGVHIRLGYNGEGTQSVYLNGRDISGEIRMPEISMLASNVSKIPAVREFLLDLQRDMAASNDVIMDGRDIGTVILPDANVKIFLTASIEGRAKRRYAELVEKGVETTYEEVLEDMRARDLQDRTRDIAPTVPAPDAVVLDNTEIDFEGTVVRALEIINEKTSGDRK